MVFPVAQRSAADGKNHIGLSVGLDAGMGKEHQRKIDMVLIDMVFPVNRYGFSRRAA